MFDPSFRGSLKVNSPCLERSKMNPFPMLNLYGHSTGTSVDQCDRPKRRTNEPCSTHECCISALCTCWLRKHDANCHEQTQKRTLPPSLHGTTALRFIACFGAPARILSGKMYLAKSKCTNCATEWVLDLVLRHSPGG